MNLQLNLHLYIKKKNKFEKLNINPKHLKLIRSAMVKVVNSDLGTAKNSMINSNKIKMAGKTGTVQVVRISEHDREKGITKNIDREWKKKRSCSICRLCTYQ